MDDDQLFDTITCCGPDETWDAMIANLQARSARAYAIAEEQRREAKDRSEQAFIHTRQAEAFRDMAATMENTRPPTPSPILLEEGENNG